MLQEQKLDQNEAAQKFTEVSEKLQGRREDAGHDSRFAAKDKQSSEPKGEAALDDLKQLQKEMEDLKNSFNSSMGSQSAEKMKGAANDVLYVSDQQEKVYDRAENSDPTSPQLQQLAAEQQALQKTLHSLDTKLKDISKESPFYSQQIDKLMKQAHEAMDQSTQGSDGTQWFECHALSEGCHVLAQSGRQPTDAIDAESETVFQRQLLKREHV